MVCFYNAELCTECVEGMTNSFDPYPKKAIWVCSFLFTFFGPNQKLRHAMFDLASTFLFDYYKYSVIVG